MAKLSDAEWRELDDITSRAPPVDYKERVVVDHL